MISKQAEELGLTNILQSNRVVRNRRDVPPSELLLDCPPKKRKLSDLDSEGLKQTGNGSCHEEVTEMYFPFVRGHYCNKNAGNNDLRIFSLLLYDHPL